MTEASTFRTSVVPCQNAIQALGRVGGAVVLVTGIVLMILNQQNPAFYIPGIVMSSVGGACVLYLILAVYRKKDSNQSAPIPFGPIPFGPIQNPQVQVHDAPNTEELSQLQNQINELKRQLETLKSEKNGLEGIATSHANALEQRADEIEAKNKQILVLEKKLEEVDAKRVSEFQASQTKDRELLNIQNKVSGLETEVTTSAEKIKQLNHQMVQLQKEVSDSHEKMPTIYLSTTQSMVPSLPPENKLWLPYNQIFLFFYYIKLLQLENQENSETKLNLEKAMDSLSVIGSTSVGIISMSGKTMAIDFQKLFERSDDLKIISDIIEFPFSSLKDPLVLFDVSTISDDMLTLAMKAADQCGMDDLRNAIAKRIAQRLDAMCETFTCKSDYDQTQFTLFDHLEYIFIIANFVNNSLALLGIERDHASLFSNSSQNNNNDQNSGTLDAYWLQAAKKREYYVEGLDSSKLGKFNSWKEYYFSELLGLAILERGYKRQVAYFRNGVETRYIGDDDAATKSILFEMFGREIKEIGFVCNVDFQTKKINHEFLENIIKFCPNVQRVNFASGLRSLSFSNDRNAVLEVFKYLVQFKELKEIEVKHSFDRDKFLKACGSLPNLNNITFSNGRSESERYGIINEIYCLINYSKSITSLVVDVAYYSSLDNKTYTLDRWYKQISVIACKIEYDYQIKKICNIMWQAPCEQLILEFSQLKKEIGPLALKAIHATAEKSLVKSSILLKYADGEVEILK